LSQLPSLTYRMPTKSTARGWEVKIIVCLATNFSAEVAEIMTAYAPGWIVFADQGVESSEAMSNVKLTLRDKGITIREL